MTTDQIVVGAIRTASGDYGTVTDGCDEFGKVLSLRESQPADLELRIDHHPLQPIGRIRAIERQRNGVVLAAFEVPGGGPADGLDLNHGFFFSIAGGGQRHYRIADPLVSVVDHEEWFCTHVGLVRGRPHMTGLPPVIAVEGNFNTRSKGGWPAMPSEWKAFLDRAMDARRPSFVRAREVELVVTAAPGCEPVLDPIEQLAAAAQRDFDVTAALVVNERGHLVHRRTIGSITSSP